MPVRLCRVTYTDRSGVSHTAEVEAESLYEAVALAVAEFRGDAFTGEPPGVTTEFTVRVVRPSVEHKITLQRVQQWAQPSTTGGPAMLVKRERLRKMLAE